MSEIRVARLWHGLAEHQITADGISKIDYEESEHFCVTRDFLNGRERILWHLLFDNLD